MRIFFGVSVGLPVFRCPACGGTEAWVTAQGPTAMQRDANVRRRRPRGRSSRVRGKPLRLWFQAMWYVTNQKHGVSALGVQRILGLGGYQTAWTWLHKLRRAMVRGRGRELLNGEVEVDETYVGGREVGVTWARKQTKTKSIVAIAAEIRGSGHWPDPNAPCRGRIRCEEPHSVSSKRLCAPGANDSNRWLVEPTTVSRRVKAIEHQPKNPFPPAATQPTLSCPKFIG